MDKTDYRGLFERADALYRAKQYPEALGILNELGREFSDNKNILYPRALCLSQMGRLDEARGICEQLIQKYGDQRALGLAAQLDAVGQAGSHSAGDFEPGWTDPAAALVSVGCGTACANHAKKQAVARCTGCAEAFCRDCLVSIEGRQYCAACKTLRVEGGETGIGSVSPPLAIPSWFGDRLEGEGLASYVSSVDIDPGKPLPPPIIIEENSSESDPSSGTASRQAGQALACAILGFFICTPVLAPIALFMAIRANNSLRDNPDLSGRGKATVALIISVIEIALAALLILGVLSRA